MSNKTDRDDPIKFSLSEIATAFGRKKVCVGGTSYAALEVVVPIDGDRVALFREGDEEEEDHEIRITTWDKVNKEHLYKI